MSYLGILAIVTLVVSPAMAYFSGIFSYTDGALATVGASTRGGAWSPAISVARGMVKLDVMGP